MAATVAGMHVIVAMTGKTAEVEITVYPVGQPQRRQPAVVKVQEYLDAGVSVEMILQHAMHLASTTVRTVAARHSVSALPEST
ncbi:hypothetical protein GIY62_20145 [Burkholderia plantarii]|nr:hypothetical protein GIY62_20145 [Burkholderia plantarii]